MQLEFSNPHVSGILQITSLFIAFCLLLKFIEPTFDNGKLEQEIAKSLMEQTIKWYKLIEQDTNTVVIYQHSNYASAYLNAARHVLNDQALERICGVNIHKLYRTIDNHQRSSSKDLTKNIPKAKHASSNVKSWA